VKSGGILKEQIQGESIVEKQLKVKLFKLSGPCIPILMLHLVCACDKVTPSPQGGGSAALAENVQKLEELSRHLGMSFPPDTVFVKDADDRVRDPHYQLWIVYSPNEITMPRNVGHPSGEYFTHSVENSTAWLKAHARHRSIENATGSFGSRWERDTFLFRGNVLRTKSGDYLLIERHLKP